MTKSVTKHRSEDDTTNRGTVKGPNEAPGASVREGGPAPSPKEAHGAVKGAASKAHLEGAVEGEDTSTATAGAHEKEHAAGAGSMKPRKVAATGSRTESQKGATRKARRALRRV